MNVVGRIPQACHGRFALNGLLYLHHEIRCVAFLLTSILQSVCMGIYVVSPASLMCLEHLLNMMNNFLEFMISYSNSLHLNAEEAVW